MTEAATVWPRLPAAPAHTLFAQTTLWPPLSCADVCDFNRTLRHKHDARAQKPKSMATPQKGRKRGWGKRRQEEGERLHVPLAHLRRVDTNNKSELVYRQNWINDHNQTLYAWKHVLSSSSAFLSLLPAWAKKAACLSWAVLTRSLSLLPCLSACVHQCNRRRWPNLISTLHWRVPT